MLEDQLTQSRKRFEQSMTLESEIIKYKQKLNDMALERDADREKLQELLDENTQLQLAMKSLNKMSDLDKLKSEEHNDGPVGDSSLSEQLTNNAQVFCKKTHESRFSEFNPFSHNKIIDTSHQIRVRESSIATSPRCDARNQLPRNSQ